MPHLFRIMLALACLGLAVAAPQRSEAKDNAPPPSAEQQARARQMRQIQDSLHPQTGDIRLPEGNAVLHLGTDYYFLPADEARKVIVDGWGNPSDAATGVLGLVFAKGKTFMDDTWGAVITFQDSGYVADDDAQSTDYNALLSQLQAGEAENNAQRVREGFPAMHLVGWAEAPAYNPANHSVVWARNLHVDGSPENTLNYDVRLLGRRGVLSVNMITGMSQLPETRAAAAKFAHAVEFGSGERYADFQPGDAKAEYGVAGLVAGGVGLVVAKKAGLLAGILLFGKKFIILIIAFFGGIAAWFRKLFGKGGNEAEPYQPAYEQGIATDAETAAGPESDDVPADLSDPEPRPG
jgi:uncharacterized membrane-anchored protein